MSTAADSAPLLVAKDLRKSYDNGRIHALDGVDLTLRRGEFVSIVGPSGSGKSTLLHVLGALDCPDSGSIRSDKSSDASSGSDFSPPLRRRLTPI